jgi:tellurite resistance protein
MTMPEFFAEVDLERGAAEAIARGLYAIARVDGLHEREAGLIASFWIEAGGGSGALSDLERSQAITPAELATALHSAAERQLFIKTALLLTWADGEVSDAERKAVHDFAKALSVDDATLEQLDAGVKDFLLGHLVHLQNTDATRAVARKLNS